MVRARFVPCSKKYDDHYSSQHGGDLGDVFIGTPVQSGYGLGGLISGLARSVVPLVGKIAKPLVGVLKPMIKKNAVPLIGKAVTGMMKARQRGRPAKQSFMEGINIGKDALEQLIRAEVDRRINLRERPRRKRATESSAFNNLSGGPRRKRSRQTSAFDWL